MRRLIDADTVVHWQTYDDEHETFPEHEGTIAEFLDAMTDEGCPEAVDAVPVRHERWMHISPEPEVMLGWMPWYCSECGVGVGKHQSTFCPNCGAKMEGKDGERDE